MGQQWRVRIIGEQRETADIDLLVQAVVALARQLARDQAACTAAPISAEQPGTKPQGACS
jgi:hypothetical protein